MQSDLLRCNKTSLTSLADYQAVSLRRSLGGERGTRMFYQLYELNHAAVQPYRAFADAMRLFYSNPLNPLVAHAVRPLHRGQPPNCSSAPRGATASRASASTRRSSTGKTVAVTEEIVWSQPFCNLIHFERDLPAGAQAPTPSC